MPSVRSSTLNLLFGVALGTASLLVLRKWATHRELTATERIVDRLEEQLRALEARYQTA